jgi:hypothetical protein
MSPTAPNLDAKAKAYRQYQRMTEYEHRAFRARHSATVLKNGANAGMRFDEVSENYIEYLQKPTTTAFRNELKDLILWHLCEE